MSETAVVGKAPVLGSVSRGLSSRDLLGAGAPLDHPECSSMRGAGPPNVPAGSARQTSTDAEPNRGTLRADAGNEGPRE